MMHQRQENNRSTKSKNHDVPSAASNAKQGERKRWKAEQRLRWSLRLGIFVCGLLIAASKAVEVFLLSSIEQQQQEKQQQFSIVDSLVYDQDIAALDDDSKNKKDLSVLDSYSGSDDSESEFMVETPDAPSCSEPIEEVSYTLVTQLSEDRLWMMEHHCERYRDRMSIAVYTNRTQDQVADDLRRFRCTVGDDAVSLSIIDSNAVGSPDEYPVNRLRNLAISKVRTTHLVYIDVDFWTSEGLHGVLMAEDVRAALLEDPRRALVIPAFQLSRQCAEWRDCRDENLRRMPRTMHDLLNVFLEKRGTVFDPTNRGGHGSTLYDRWMRPQATGSLVEIPCLRSRRYEPFLAVRRCRELPPFQEKFSGYGKNKMTWTMQLVRNGYALSQVGGAYLVHYPHLDSPSRQHWNEAPERLRVGENHVRRPEKLDGNSDLHLFKRGQVDELYVEFRQWLEDEVPDQSVLKPCEDAQDDDSKLWLDRSTYNGKEE